MAFLLVWLPAAILALAFPAGAQDRLPACPGQSPSAAWTKCTGTHVFPSGGIYTGEFEDGKRNGQGVLTLPSGEQYAGGFRDGRYAGRGTLTFPDRTTYEGDFWAGQFDGYGTVTFADGGRYVGEVRNGKRHGQGTEFAANGTVLRSGMWENNLFVGR